MHSLTGLKGLKARGGVMLRGTWLTARVKVEQKKKCYDSSGLASLWLIRLALALAPAGRARKAH